MTAPPEPKKALRAAMRDRLAALSPEQCHAESRAIVSALIARPEWKEARSVLLFHPLAGEPDLTGLWVLAGERRLVLPRMEADRLAFHAVSDPASMVPSRWGLREPDPALHPRVHIESPDLALIPGLAFTTQGDRLGKGAGFYDRLLGDPGFRAVTLGVCFRVQILAHLPCEPHDRRVGGILTAPA